jgi:hypothetical protein
MELLLVLAWFVKLGKLCVKSVAKVSNSFNKLVKNY